MYDKLELRILFKPSSFVGYTPENGVFGGRSGIDSGAFVDYRRYSTGEVGNDWPLKGDIQLVDGIAKCVSSYQHTWESIATNSSSLAIGFFPHGKGLFKDPHVLLKASPAKILQGHNAYGSDDLRHGAVQMLALLQLTYPKMFDDLDIKNSEIRILDCTFFANLSDFHHKALVSVLASVTCSGGSYDKHIDSGYLMMGTESTYYRQKIYRKITELESSLKTAKRQRSEIKTAILSDETLLDFSRYMTRFEATIFSRCLIQKGIPTKLSEFLKFSDWYKSVHNEPVSHYLWRISFKSIFQKLEGQTMTRVDDEAIEARIHSKFDKINSKGRICRRKSNAVIGTYRDILRVGYASLLEHKSRTFMRNKNYLFECGLSEVFLRSLSPHVENSNIVPFVQVIKIDFNAQVPDNFKEPVSGFNEIHRLIAC